MGLRKSQLIRALALCALVCPLGSGRALAAAGSAAPAQATSAANGFSAESLPAAQQAIQLAAMHGNGVKVVRSDAAWSDIEPQAPTAAGPTWQWAKYDAWVAQLAEHGLSWQPIIDYAVGWAKTCPGFCAPDSDAPFAAFAQAVAARYGAGGSFWTRNPGLPYAPVTVYEIWNEENTAAFSVPAARYATLYRAARDAIHAVDPSASVDIGGLADDSQSFDVNRDYAWWYIDQLVSADPSIVGKIDGISLHPYGATAADVLAWVADFRRVLRLVGLGDTPIDITEVGWTTGDATREAWRASQMSQLAGALGNSTCGIRLLAPYTWINPSILNESGDFGLVDRTGSDAQLRPAGAAWFAGLGLAGQRARNTLCGASAPAPGSGSASTPAASAPAASSTAPQPAASSTAPQPAPASPVRAAPTRSTASGATGRSTRSATKRVADLRSAARRRRRAGRRPASRRQTARPSARPSRAG